MARIIEMEKELDEIDRERKGRRREVVGQAKDLPAGLLAFDGGGEALPASPPPS